MAILEVQQGDANAAAGSTLQPGDLWRHYVRSGLLYEDKLSAVAAVLPEILAGWPRHFAASEEVFALAAVRGPNGPSSSLCRMRDTDHLMLLQHAASQGDPVGTLACVLATMQWYDTLGRTAGTLGYFFRAENAWPARIVDALCSAIPDHAISLQRRALLSLSAHQVRGRSGTAAPAVEDDDWPTELRASVARVGVDSGGLLRAHATCLLDDGHQLLPDCQRWFGAAGILRRRRIHPAWRDGEVAALAVRHITAPSASLSRLDTRVELVVRPDAPDRAALIGELVSGVALDLPGHGDADLLVLVDPADEPAAAAAGCRPLGRAYSDVILDARDHEVVCRARAGILGLYDRVAATADRRRQRAQVAPTGGSDEVAA